MHSFYLFFLIILISLFQLPFKILYFFSECTFAPFLLMHVTFDVFLICSFVQQFELPLCMELCYINKLAFSCLYERLAG